MLKKIVLAVCLVIGMSMSATADCSNGTCSVRARVAQVMPVRRVVSRVVHAPVVKKVVHWRPVRKFFRRVRCRS